MQKPVEFTTPVKGVIKATTYTDAPADAAFDALNVLPWDRGGRLRLCQRSGVTSQLSIGHRPVKALSMATFILTENHLVVDQFSQDQAISYPDGEIAEATGGKWVAVYDPSVLPPTLHAGVDSTPRAAQTGVARVVGGKFVQDSGVGDGQVALFYTPENSQLETGVYHVLASIWAPFPLVGCVDAAYAGARVIVGVQRDGLGHFYANPDRAWMVSLTEDGTGTSHRYHWFLSKYTAGGWVVQANGYYDYGQTITEILNFGIQVSGSRLEVVLDGAGVVHTVNNVSIDIPDVLGIGMGPGLSQSLYSMAVLTTSHSVGDRQVVLLGVSGSDWYVGPPANMNLATHGGGVFKRNALVQMAYTDGKVYAVDGVAVRMMDLSTQTVQPFTASAGAIPQGCRYCCVWRGRLILGSPLDNPQNFFASRVGDATDWDYADTDAATAFAGNASTAGHIGEPITALIPFSDDILLIGGDHNLWAVRGDPADGGSIDPISDAVGILGPNAWCKAPDGTVYFVGTGGLYRMVPGSIPENISSQTWNEYFAGIDRSKNYVNMVWDRDRQGAYVFITPIASGPAKHLWYDQRTGGFWPIQFADPAQLGCGGGVGCRQRCLAGQTGGQLRVAAHGRGVGHPALHEHEERRGSCPPG